MKNESPRNDSGTPQVPSEFPKRQAPLAFVEKIGCLGIGCCCLDLSTFEIRELNSAFADLVGSSENELVGTPLIRLLSDDDQSGLVQDLSSLVKGGHCEVSRTLFVQVEGKPQRWIKATFALWDQDNENIPEECIVTTAIDITGSIKAERERDQLAQRMELSEEQSQAGCWELVRGEEIGWWSKQLYRLYDLDPNGPPPSIDQFIDLIHPDDREQVLTAHGNDLQINKSIDVEFRRNPEIGELRWLHSRVTAIERGGETIWFGTTRDVTEQHKMKAELIRSEKLYREIVESASEGICMVDANGCIAKINDVAAEMFGYTPDELIGKSIFELVGEGLEDDLRENFKLRSEGVGDTVEYRIKHSAGREVWLLVSSQPCYDEHGEFSGTRNVVLNITNRKLAEQLARKAAIARTKLEMLSTRERDVFKHVVSGQMNKVIAKRLEISEKTVERHRSNVMKKLGVKSVAELVRIAMDAESIEH
ncbi:PAS domain S-box protein [Aporhodopirellula aestuarii]|nr:PAS domain S-box protein [Aporhodopirellula aestuarii]